MTERHGHVLRIERTFEAPATAVFDAWTNEEVLRGWFHADPDWETPTADVDLRVGGKLRIVMRDPEAGEDHGASGEYRVVDRPHRLTFTWSWDRHDTEVQLIELEFTERDGATTVRMTSHGIATGERRDEHEEGWGRCFDNLDRILAA
ncbi:MAG: hypothetical protein QOJ01_2466 [Solirubrobacterales bacterium]|jgi:uncharacterized protein YndB with AHSA1/START domain|nr:hypothetical protein [Solirubrobacterales bacterium]